MRSIGFVCALSLLCACSSDAVVVGSDHAPLLGQAGTENTNAQAGATGDNPADGTQDMDHELQDPAEGTEPVDNPDGVDNPEGDHPEDDAADAEVPDNPDLNDEELDEDAGLVDEHPTDGTGGTGGESADPEHPAEGEGGAGGEGGNAGDEPN